MLEQIQQYKIVPVVVVNNMDEACNVFDGLVAGGLPVAEVCFRSECAEQALQLAVNNYPDMLVGAGTVINAKQCRKAIACGAKFIVSPGLSKEVAAVCKRKNVPYVAGVVTPTEVMAALELGLTTLKFFPASNYGGLATIKALCAAFPQVRIMPTGGIDDKNIAEYLAYPKIVACGGSWMCKGTREEIAEKCKKALQIVNS